MRDEISQFIVNKFCKENKVEASHCNDLVVISQALHKTIENGYISYDEGMKYANGIAKIQPLYIKEEPDWVPTEEAQDGGWEEGCWRNDYNKNVEHNKSNKEAFLDITQC